MQCAKNVECGVTVEGEALGAGQCDDYAATFTLACLWALEGSDADAVTNCATAWGELSCDALCAGDFSAPAVSCEGVIAAPDTGAPTCR